MIYSPEAHISEESYELSTLGDRSHLSRTQTA
jgi:hypothetical protein